MSTRAYAYNRAWNAVLPDGPAFCHWGGKELSHRVLTELAVKPEDRVLDICCGEGGTLNLLRTGERYGIDVNPAAIAIAQRNSTAIYAVADAKHTAFPAAFFTKLFSQDPDVLLEPQREQLFLELYRISAQSATLLIQTYARTEHSRRTEELLIQAGYTYTDVVTPEILQRLVAAAGFVITSIDSLHDIYEQDNTRMRANLAQHKESIPAKDYENLRCLLEREAALFANKLWTGILLKANKN